MSALQDVLLEVQSRIESGDSLVFLQTDDEQRAEQLVRNIASQLQRTLQVWSLDIAKETGNLQAESSLSVWKYLRDLRESEHGQIFLAKDIQYFFSEPAIVRALQDFANLPVAHGANRNPLILLGHEFRIPPGLAGQVSLIRLPLPDFEELKTLFSEVIDQHPTRFSIREEFTERMVKSVVGLSLQQARRAFRRVLHGRDDLGEEVMTMLISEKKELLQGTELLEFCPLDETVDDIGGLEGLKDWVDRRVKAFGAEAQKRHVGQPKGVLLLGVQGCGKSLSARVIARQLSFPLIRLDFGSLLQGERGRSEQNLREVLRMMDSVAPAVLWIEELDKGFSGLEGGGDQKDAVLSRMFGLFLTWMQEHTAPVFVVATANAIENLPPELLRRGRFDELFFIDLPNFHERQQIFRIHLSRRGCDPAEYALDELSDKTEGYSGAEIEQVVNAAVIDAYASERLPSEKELQETISTIVPLSVTMEEKVFQLREWARSRCRPATPDSRVMRMLEDEQRKGEGQVEEAEFSELWLEMLQAGDLPGAVLEFVRSNDMVTFPKLQKAFGPYRETTGLASVVLSSDHHVAVWDGLDVELAQAVARYVNGKRIFLNPVDVSHYQKLGTVLTLPVLRALREKPLPRDVWFPALLRIMPPREGSGRLREVIVRDENGSQEMIPGNSSGLGSAK